MPTFLSPDAIALAANALYQLNRLSIFPRTGIGSYEEGAFEKGDVVTIRRPRIVEAIDYDPRSGVPASQQEPGYISTQLTLERLFTAGFPVYSHDAREKLKNYVVEYSQQIAASIATKVDSYFYNKFRTVPVDFPTTGPVSYGFHPPVQITASVNDTGGLISFNDDVLLAASGVLDQREVPGWNRYALLSTRAKTSFLGDAILVEGFAGAMAGGSQLLQSGLPAGQFTSRRGFLVGGSSAITSPSQAGLIGYSSAISAAADDTTVFLEADVAADTPLGAVTLTLLDATGVAVGQIARIGTANLAKAFGFVLRVTGTSVMLVPYSPSGEKLVAAEIDTATDLFTVPKIGSISLAFHQEALLFTTRTLSAPSEGSGATMVSLPDPETSMSIQILRGSYQVDSFKESQRAAWLGGAKLTDHRKAVLMLSA